MSLIQSSVAQKGHNVNVTAIGVSPDHRYIATGAQDGSIVLWSGTSSFTRRMVMRSHSADPVTFLQFSGFGVPWSDRYGNFLVSTYGSKIIVWDILSNEEVPPMPILIKRRTFRLHEHHQMHSCKWVIPEGQSIALSALTVGSEGSIFLATLERYTQHSFSCLGPMNVLDGPESSIGNHLVCSSNGMLIGVMHPSTVRLFRVKSQLEEMEPECSFVYGPGCSDAHVQFSCTTFIGNEQLLVGLTDGTICWWDIPSEYQAQCEPRGTITAIPPEESGCRVIALNVSPQSYFVAALCEAITVVPILRREVGHGDFFPHVFLRGHPASVTTVSFSSCEMRVATASDTNIYLWSLMDGSLLWSSSDHASAVTHIAFTQGGRILVSGDEQGYIRMYRLPISVPASMPPPPDRPHRNDHHDDEDRKAARQCVFDTQTSLHKDAVSCLTFSADGSLAASGSEEGSVIIWGVTGNNAPKQLEGHGDTVSALAFSRDNCALASASLDELIFIWDVARVKKLKELRPSGAMHSLVYTPDGSKLIAGASDGKLYIWDSTTYLLEKVLEKNTHMVMFIVFSHDGQRMATGGMERVCYIWETAQLDAPNPEPLSVLDGHRDIVCAAAFSPDGNRLVTASYDGSSRVWKAETGEVLVILHEHIGPVWSVAFSPDGKRLVSGSSDSTVKVCDSYSGKRILSLKGHDGMINDIDVSPDGQRIASASADNTVRLWGASDGECKTTFNEHDDNVASVMFSPDGIMLASGSLDGKAVIRPVFAPGHTVWRMMYDGKSMVNSTGSSHAIYTDYSQSI